MPERSSSPNKTLPQSCDLRNAYNIDALCQCIRDARRGGRHPDAPPTERYLHRIVGSAALHSLQHIKSHQAAPARQAERLANDAIRQLEKLRPETAPYPNGAAHCRRGREVGSVLLHQRHVATKTSSRAWQATTAELFYVRRSLDD